MKTPDVICPFRYVDAPLFIRPDITLPEADELTLIDQETVCVPVGARQVSAIDRSLGLGRSRPTQHIAPPLRAPHHWGVVLAGGDGIRLRELTRSMYGDDRPKQFCPLLGNRTLLEETRRRAEKSLPAEQILFAVTRSHESYYLPYLTDRLSQTIVQPFNRGTAPAIAYALTLIAQEDQDAIVSILPSDHYYSPESIFNNTLEIALEIAEQHAGFIVLLGVEPKGPEIEYGWILTGEGIQNHPGLFRVEGFEEKPPLGVARTLFENGSLWNTFVMIGHVRAFLDMIEARAPDLLRSIQSCRAPRQDGVEIRIPDSIYGRIAPLDFSKGVLTSTPDRLLALRLESIDWSDLGDPYRVLVTLVEKEGELPKWAKLWPEPESGQAPLAATATV